MSSELEERAVRFLRGEENPFDAIVVPDKPAAAFAECHAPEIHREESAKLVRVLEKYRRPAYATRRQLHETRVLIVRGTRGNGKTHLMQMLVQGLTDTPELWVCPRYYDPAFPFAEYLLNELVRALLSTERPDASARLGWCAGELGRRLLSQAVATVSPQEWREWLTLQPGGASSGRRRFRRAASDREQLLAALEQEGLGVDLPAVCRERGLSPSAAEALVLRHVEAAERGASLEARIRREILLGFSELAFRGARARLDALLEHDFALPNSAIPPARFELVTALLQTLAEVLAAIRVPTIFAIDNIERLFAPRGVVEEAVAQSFFTGLAHTTDQTKGILFMLLVETGLWNELGNTLNKFAESRLLQGVRVPDYGCLSVIDLELPTPEQIEQVVQRRMAPLLARAGVDGALPPTFPFEAAEVRQIAAKEADVVRTVLLRLRDRYDELVLPTSQRKVPQTGMGTDRPGRTPPPPPNQLQSDWEETVARARRQLEGTNWSALVTPFHKGLGRWLELLVGREVHGWRLESARSSVPFGDRPNFGVVTVAHWARENGRTCRTAVGPILGRGAAMPGDMEAKLSALRQRPPLADRLVVLFPVRQEGAPAVQLPPATNQVWERGAAGDAARLVPLAYADLAWLLAFAEWFPEGGGGDAEDQLKAFIWDRTGHLLAELAPDPR